MIEANKVNPRVTQEKIDEAYAMMKAGKPIIIISQILKMPIRELIRLNDLKH